MVGCAFSQQFKVIIFPRLFFLLLYRVLILWLYPPATLTLSLTFQCHLSNSQELQHLSLGLLPHVCHHPAGIHMDNPPRVLVSKVLNFISSTDILLLYLIHFLHHSQNVTQNGSQIKRKTQNNKTPGR